MSSSPAAGSPKNSSPNSDRPRSGVTPVWSAAGLVAAVCAILLVITFGVAANPSETSLPQRNDVGAQVSGSGPVASGSGGGEVAPTGETTEVTITATEDMRFEPAAIEVPAGNQLVVTLVNEDPVNGHDLVIGDVTSGRLQPGATESIDFGVQSFSQEGYCSVAGHRQMGMVLDVVVSGTGTGTGTTSAGAPVDGTTAQAAPIQNVDGAQIANPYPAELEPLPAADGPVNHEVTFSVTEVPLEVAPGLYQTRWTFNGSSMGPVLHGRVGDTFEITLVNDGSMGHSIDFHAGALAPDGPMRTIAAGESLVYRYTAERAGIWMYHCSTAPMSTHIAAGMHGAVIIEPEGLAEVDRQYVVVQSEVYLANEAHTPAEATELDAGKIAAGTPDRVVFNGIANQYDQERFTAKVGERVRFWVLDAGPNVPLAFHIVGGQFDTTWSEGTYGIRQGESWTGANDGGAQVLSLLPAEGGFVELEFPEAGNYSVVNHIMSEAERGAHGVVHVTE